jgi:GNAT superfamily N-acetyltransferase
MPSPFRIEAATEADIPVILRLIKALAEYERLAHAVTATEDQLRATLFGPRRSAEVLIGYVDRDPVAFAVYFQNFSTFLGMPGLYLEDLFVRPEWRKHGFGRALLSRLASVAVERGCGRMEWSVLDWNEPAIGFYRSLGAEPMDEWTVFRVTGPALSKLAQGATEPASR